MGQIEERVQKRARWRSIKHMVLAAAALGGITLAMLTAPNMFKAIPKTLLRKLNATTKGSVRSAIVRLQYDGLMKTEVRGDQRFLRITKRGKEYLDRVVSQQTLINRPPRWDEKWRIVIFDIKEVNRSTRANIRSMLSSVGFLKLQNSVWVLPYPCEDFVSLLKADAKIGRAVLYLVVEEIENDQWIRKHFGLSSAAENTAPKRIEHPLLDILFD